MTDGVRRPPIPTPASRARTIAARGGQAALLPGGGPAGPAVATTSSRPAADDVDTDPDFGGWFADEPESEPRSGRLTKPLSESETAGRAESSRAAEWAEPAEPVDTSATSATSAGAFGGKVEPHLHHVHTDGAVTPLLPDDHPLIAAALHAPRGELAAMVEIADRAAVTLREPVRGLLWITGWLRVLDEAAGRLAALVVSETQPDSRLLDVGHGVTVLRLSAASMVLADGEGSGSLRPAEFAAAKPDPFCEYEDNWLRHLDSAHRDVVGMLTRLLPEGLRGGHVRPLGLDRFGLRLRVELADDDHDVRLAFSQPVDTPTGLASELRRMVGCPFLAQARKSA